MALDSARSSRHGSRTASTSGTRGVVRHRIKETETKAKATPKPDIEELRRLRASYFGRPFAQGSKVIRPKTSNVVTTLVEHPVKSGESRCRKSVGNGTVKRHRHDSESRSARHAGDSERRMADYVYGPPPSEEPRPSRDGTEKRRHRSTRQAHNAPMSAPREERRSRRVLSVRSELPMVTDDELRPEDSISSVGMSREHARTSHPAETRPTLRRSNTTSIRLAPVLEDGSDETAPPPSRPKPKRNSSLIGSLFRRNTTSSVPPAPRYVECMACLSDDVPHAESAKLSCGHRMCHECLRRLFELSVKDPAHMPPKCCTIDHIPLKHVDKLFDLKFKLLWNRKFQEYNTRNRVYCTTPKCGEWIRPQHFHAYQGRKYAQCPRCRTKVCTLCNNKMHKSRDCPQDPEIAKLVQQAKEKGWQRCYSCSSLVELKEGCNHMTCRCMAEFCMICGAKWKSCDCPWFNYSNLPNPDRLNDMRVPEPIQVIYRQLCGAAAGPLPVPPNQQARQPPRQRTYQDEMSNRRRQERLDADLARRLQLASLMEPAGGPDPARQAHDETWGLGNAAGHFMNENFVNNAANIVMNAFANADYGRRGERASGRRRRPPQPETASGPVGLAPNFLGDESVLGAGPGRR